jgi:hypothetical protein
MTDFAVTLHRVMYQHKPNEYCKDCPGITIVSRKKLRARCATKTDPSA